MSYIFESFKDWNKKVNEDNTLDKLKIRNDIDQKMIIKVINDRTFKVRAKWGGDVIDALSNLTQTGWSRIMQEINNTIPEGGRYPLINSMPPLKDLTKNIVVYEVIKDTDTAKDPNPNIKKQSFQFTVVPRPVGVPTNIEFVSRDDVNSLPKTSPSQLSQSTDVKTGEVLAGPKKSGETYGLNLSKGAIALTNLTDPKLINLIDAFYFKVSEDGGLSENPQVKAILKGIKAELVAKTLGDNSKTLISALNAAFSITTRYGDPETGITQTLLNNMANAKSKENEGTLLSEIEGFNTGAFLANLKPISNIVVPTGGFVKGKVTKDPEFAKFQQLLAAKFQKSLGSSKIYKNFSKFQVGGADGTYGGNTANLVGLLKSALTEPKWTGNMDKNNVDQAFVDRINQEKVVESYIGLDGFTLVVEGIDMTAVQSYEGGAGRVSAGGSGGRSNKGSDSSSSSSSNKSDRKYLESKPDYSYFVKDKVWHFEKGGKSGILLNAKSIEKLITDNPESGGHYIDLGLKDGKTVRTSNNLYKLENGIWKVSIQGKSDFLKVTDTSLLDSIYGSISDTSQEKPMTEKEIDVEHMKIAKKIKSWFPSKFKGDRFRAGFGKSESAVWKEFENMWNGTSDDSVKNMLAKTGKAIKAIGSSEVKARLTANQGHLFGIKNKGTDAAYSFKSKLFDNGKFTIRLRLGSGESFALTIDTDF
jgi:hypothetical protein